MTSLASPNQVQWSLGIWFVVEALSTAKDREQRTRSRDAKDETQGRRCPAGTVAGQRLIVAVTAPAKRSGDLD